jgi:hypothetical protein
VIEATGCEKPHRLDGELLPGVQLLGLPEAHATSVTQYIQLQK